MWQAIVNVTSGLTLVAFLAACVVAIVLAVNSREIKLIETVPPARRAELVALHSEKVHIPVDGLSSAERARVLLEQLRERRRRLSLVLGFALAAGVVFGVFQWLAQNANAKAPERDSGPPSIDTALPTAPAVSQVPPAVTPSVPATASPSVHSRETMPKVQRCDAEARAYDAVRGHCDNKTCSTMALAAEHDACVRCVELRTALARCSREP